MAAENEFKDIKKGDKFTVFYISKKLETIRKEFTVEDIRIGSPSIQMEVEENGKRWTYTPHVEHLVLKGHLLPLKADTDFSRPLRNNNYNLVSLNKKMALYTIDTQLVHTLTEYHKNHILFTPISQLSYTKEGETLYSDND